METNPLISVIVPNYNGAKFIFDTINSVLSQSYPHFEIIVIDDGSTDDSVNIVKGFSDNRVFLYYRDDNYPKGANSCRNIGIEKAIGEYLIFLDSDDLLDKCCLKKRIEYMDANPNLDFAVFNMRSFSHNTDDGAIFTRLNCSNPILHFIGADFLWQTTAVIWKADFVREIKGFNLSYQRLQDPEMTLRALLKSKGNYELVKDSCPDSYFRKNDNNRKWKNKNQYYSMFKYVQDFYTINNSQYLNSVNTFFFFYCLTLFHFTCREDDNDDREYKEAIRTISFFNSSVIHHFLYKMSTCSIIISLFRKFDFIKKIAFIYRNFYINYYFNRI